MIERKFKEKRINTNEWVTRDLLHIAGGCLIYFGSPTEVDKEGPARKDVCVVLLMSECAPVFPETVREFTNLYDSFREEIWEGDILQDFEHNQYTVKFKDGMFGIERNDKFKSIINNEYWRVLD